MGEDVGSVPLEFVGKVARAGAVGEPGNVKRSSAATRHCECCELEGGGGADEVSLRWLCGGK